MFRFPTFSLVKRLWQIIGGVLAAVIWLYVCILQLKKRFIKIRLIFDIENGFENQNFAIFDHQYQIKWNMYLEHFYGHFHKRLAWLLTAKLSYTQLFKWGHSKMFVCNVKLTNVRFSKMCQLNLKCFWSWKIWKIGRIPLQSFWCLLISKVSINHFSSNIF